MIYRALLFSILLIGLSMYGCKKDTISTIPPNDLIDTIPPEEVNRFEFIYSDSSITLRWRDPNNTDLDKLEITFGNSFYYVEKGIQQKTFFDLKSGVKYFFKIRTIDTIGNRSSGVWLYARIEYRFGYTGYFVFTSYVWFESGASNIYADTVVYIGNIQINEESDTTIQIRYRPGEQTDLCHDYVEYIEPNLKISGELEYPEFVNCNEDNHFFGNFINKDTLSIWIGQIRHGVYFGRVINGKRMEITELPDD